jgi:FMN phosphatase YigB (HAD superfamily)
VKKAVLFDLGKVLLDFDKDVILDGFRQKTDLPEEEIQHGLELYHELGFETGATSPEDFYRCVNKELRLGMAFDGFREVWCNIFREIPPMVELFHGIRKKYETYILSNTDPLHFPYVLEQFPWLEMFDGRAISYELGVRKPNREFFIMALKKFGKTASECVYIDDIDENVLAARELGIDSVLHSSPEQTISLLTEMGIDTNG